MTTSKDLIQVARETLEQGGWTQGSFSNGEGHCVVGALNYAMYRASVDRQSGLSGAYNHAVEDIVTATGVPVFSTSAKAREHLIHWNDDPARTQEDVILVLKKAEAHDA